MVSYPHNRRTEPAVNREGRKAFKIPLDRSTPGLVADFQEGWYRIRRDGAFRILARLKAVRERRKARARKRAMGLEDEPEGWSAAAPGGRRGRWPPGAIPAGPRLRW
jgi:hypothetical protein